MNYVSTSNGHYIYDERTAREFFESLGIDEQDFDSICYFMHENSYDNLTYERDALKDELASYEATLDERRSMLCEIQNLCDEALAMKRISKARERFEAISKMINQEL